ncbi:hypothetical protein FHR75_003936 [Kineococcus radiotolerans]|uniref:Novel STAND NTPase 5 domain-containing protein n=1 Tax=Kineococcus radiotolerans TaxID=131568 RepID=A0A7W4XZA7_KINRA|nr:ATP-binding protein [Kineococcus radiotolerans]MBB2903094.1 hypothetical protein [Kineococcus radiotolerans]
MMPEANPADDATPAEPPRSNGLPGRNPLLPPTESLSHEAFEDFTERLLNAHKFAGPEVLRTVHVVRWGRPGDPQDGIDFAGTLSDGRTASWQCKRYDTFSVADTRAAIKKDTYGADVHYLVLSCQASTPVRREIKKHPTWHLLDKRGLQQLLEDLPRHKRHDVLDATFGPDTRRRLMTSPGQDLVISLQAFARDRLDHSTILNDRGSFTGRERELEGLVSALTSPESSARAVLITGPGGRGKTRLLLEALQQVEESHPERPVVLLAPGAPLSPQAIQELPSTAAVIIVDDAHQHPEAVPALMSYLRQVPGTQVVLTCRPSGSQAVYDALIDRLGPDDVHAVQVGRLPLSEGRRLVEALGGGLNLPWTYREQLAREAVDSPHVAVIALGLIRRGEMTRLSVIDHNLRQRVLARYRDVTTGIVSGVDADQVAMLLAVYAALHGIRDDDAAASQHLRELTGLTQRQLLQVRKVLRKRGVLVTRQEPTSVVVPEILGDDALERQAVIDGHDTGFVTGVWQHFGASEGPRLAGSLAELEWRLKGREGDSPDVLSVVWADLQDHLLSDDLNDVMHWLQSLDQLTFTHPQRFLSLLEELRARLLGLGGSHDSISESVQDSKSDQVQRPLDAAQQPQALFMFAAATPADVLAMLTPLYQRCAANDPDLLEQALEALWALHHLPQHLQKPEIHRAGANAADVTGVLTDLGRLPDPSFPMRIVDTVKRWLQDTTATPEGTNAKRVSPLSVLQPLLVKQITLTEQSDLHTLQVSNRLISPTWAAPFRERIRQVLTQHASGADIGCAAEAVSLLRQMLLPLRPALGSTITAEQDAEWDEDELATVRCLAHAAEATTSSAVRRHIRHDVAWSAEHARSLPARQEALALVTVLDQRAEDDLAEALAPRWRHETAHRRGLNAPTLPELSAQLAARAARSEAMTDDELAAKHETRVASAYERHREARGAALARAVDSLSAQSTAQDRAQDTAQGAARGAAEDMARSMVAALDSAARDVAAVTTAATAGGGGLHASALYAALAQARPDLVPGLLKSIAAGDDGPLDRDAHTLVESWRQHDQDAALTWLGSAANLRVGMRRGIAHGWALHLWLEAGPAFWAVFDAGVADPDDAVRETHLLAAFQRFPDQPGRAAHLLLDAAASAPVCLRALQNLQCAEPTQWGADLSQADAMVMLQLLARAGWEDWTSQEIAAGVAASHPVLLLDHLAVLATVTGRQTDSDSLPAALEANAAQTGAWLLERGPQLTSPQRQQVADAAFPDGLGPAVAAVLAEGMVTADAPCLLAIVDCLQDVSLWPAHQPRLARAMLTRAHQIASSPLGELQTYLSDALTPTVYTSSNGASPELQTAHTLCNQLAVTEPDADLKQLFISHRDYLAALMASMQREDEDEE